MSDGMTISLEPSGSQKQAIHQRTDLSGICKKNFFSGALVLCHDRIFSHSLQQTAPYRNDTSHIEKGSVQIR